MDELRTAVEGRVEVDEPFGRGDRHDVHVVRTVATRVTAFAEGKTIAEGSADEVFDSDSVKRVFLRGRRDA